MPAQAPAAKTLLNLDRNGVALAGPDPVAYFTLNKAVKGGSEFSSRYLGATYLFASREHKDWRSSSCMGG
jgi:YHS domain-containing protein